MGTQKYKAFTLVELIVVIVILAILATIAFLSFSSQSASARDSTRLSDMSNISKGLGVFQATAGTLPKPDSNITVYASGITISYQGYAGLTVLGMAKLSNGGKDPLDSTYYTYTTNTTLNKYQIIGFLEDGSNSALGFLPFGRAKVNADPATYSGRFLLSKGESIGTLLNSATMVPVQSAAIDIDLATTNSGTVYKTIFASENAGSNMISSGGLAFSCILTIRSDLNQNKSLSKVDSTLVGYWDMENFNGTKLKDMSKYGNDGTCYESGAIIDCSKAQTGLTLTDGTGRTGKSISFRKDMANYIYANTIYSQYSSGTFPRTLSAWLYLKDITSQYGGGIKYGSDYAISTYSTNKPFFYGYGAKDILGSTPLSLNKWYLMTVVYNGTDNRVYLNGVLDALPNTTVLSTTVSGIIIGNINTGFWNGNIDEVKIYNRALSDFEILNNYNSSK